MGPERPLDHRARCVDGARTTPTTAPGNRMGKNDPPTTEPGSRMGPEHPLGHRARLLLCQAAAVAVVVGGCWACLRCW
jgi:hypothetical protein